MERATQPPIVGGLPDAPGITAAMGLSPGLGVHLRGLADALLVDDFPGATLRRACRIGRCIGDCRLGRILGKANRPMTVAGSAGRGSCPQCQLRHVGAGNCGWVGHPLPQLEGAAEMPQRLAGSKDGCSLTSRGNRRRQGAGKVVAG